MTQNSEVQTLVGTYFSKDYLPAIIRVRNHIINTFGREPKKVIDAARQAFTDAQSKGLTPVLAEDAAMAEVRKFLEEENGS